MLADSIKNAKLAALEFANNSGATLGKLKMQIRDTLNFFQLIEA